MIKTDYDLVIIGGGINGAGVARDAAGRGLSVLLLEARDLACGTSSSSTKLIHGGLRYLEFFEFNLVRKALQERERLLHIAPHLISPMKFVLPHDPKTRPFWMIRAGLFLYDHLAKRKSLPKSTGMDLAQDIIGAPLIDEYKKAFIYSDCWVDDARLVVLNARDAADRGAEILTHARCTNITAHDDHWKIAYRPDGHKRDKHVSASMVVNAGGPWVRQILDDCLDTDKIAPHPNVRLVKGSHIIIPRSFDGDHAYIVQQSDRRIVFAIPYEHNYTLIGTTEENFDGDLYDPRISDEELDYLCNAYNTHFKSPITRKDILWSYSGVRPLFDDGDTNPRTVTRDYVLHTNANNGPKMISLFGGKLTTYRVMAQEVVDKLLHLDNRYAPPWTADEPLPGGDIPNADFPSFVAAQSDLYPWLPPESLTRYCKSYGTCMDKFLSGAKSTDDLGQDYGDHVYEAEIVYMLAYEFARDSEDIFWRRSKLGIHVNETTIKAVEKALPALKKALKTRAIR